MAEELIQDFENHIIKCRCCLKDFEIDDTQIKITAIVQSRFKDLTQLELKISEKYSEVICEPCNIELKTISAFRKELISKQRNLSEFVEGFVEDFGQEEELELVKHEAEENVVIKAEPDCEVHEDYSMFINTEYLEGLQDEVVDASGEEFQGEEFAYVKAEKGSYASAYPRSKGMKKHYKRALCGLCGNSYYKDQLQRHIDKVHYKVKRFFCDICGFGSFLKCNMSQHITKHVAKEYRVQILCTLCPATFTRHESLKNHMKTEHDSNPEMLKCFCGKEFNLRHKLTTHIKRTHNNARDHACDFSSCSKRFFTPKELKVHILKCHTPNYVDRSEHFCEICGKKYSSSKSLRTHMKHHQEPEFKCSFDGCNKGFISKLLLANHEKIHLGQRDFQCDQCEKAFFSANHLRRHIAVTHTKVKVNCFIESCRFSVGRKDYLRNHVLSHRELSEEVKNAYLVQIRDMKI